MGDFDMAVGKEIVSAFAGAADAYSFDVAIHRPSDTLTIKTELSEAEKELNELYQKVRDFRELKSDSHELLKDILAVIKANHTNDWLLPLEIYELSVTKDTDLAEEALLHLQQVKSEMPGITHLVDNGLELISKQLTNTYGTA